MLFTEKTCNSCYIFSMLQCNVVIVILIHVRRMNIMMNQEDDDNDEFEDES